MLKRFAFNLVSQIKKNALNPSLPDRPGPFGSGCDPDRAHAAAKGNSVTADTANPDDFQHIHGGRLQRSDLHDFVRNGVRLHMSDCDLTEADMSRLDMAGWWFERCTLKSTRFSGAILDAACFENCRGGFANFGTARMGEVRLQASDFNNARFSEAQLTGAEVTGCKLTGADFTKAGTTGLSVKDTLLVSARLAAVSFRKAVLTCVDFSLADLAGADFREAVFDGCSLRETIITGTRFDGADLRGADLGGLRLTDAGQFKGATVSRRQAADLLAQLGLKVL